MSCDSASSRALSCGRPSYTLMCISVGMVHPQESTAILSVRRPMGHQDDALAVEVVRILVHRKGMRKTSIPLSEHTANMSSVADPHTIAGRTFAAGLSLE